MNTPETPSLRAGPGAKNSKRAPRGRWFTRLGATALLAVLVFGLWPKPARIEVTRVTAGPLQASILEEGRTRVRQRYVVSAPVTGQLRRVSFKVGAGVVSNETVLAVIDPLNPSPLDSRARSLAQAKRDTAAANLEKARSAHSFAIKERQRVEALHLEKTVSTQELENVQWREVSADRELSATASLLREAEAQLAEFVGWTAPLPEDTTNRTVLAPVEVRAPATGRVLRVIEESSRTVGAGAPLLEVGDPADLEVVIEVLSRDGALIQPGMPVDLEQWGGVEPLRAKVRWVEPAAFTKVSALGVEEQRVNVIADFITPPGQRGNLGDQFRVEGRIVTWSADSVVKVPSGALFRRGNEWAAFVLEDGHARIRSVKAGRAGGAETQILDGLREGDEVILYPGDRIQDGMRVQLAGRRN